jgi:hypothetical protein
LNTAADQLLTGERWWIENNQFFYDGFEGYGSVSFSNRGYDHFENNLALFDTAIKSCQ